MNTNKIFKMSTNDLVNVLLFFTLIVFLEMGYLLSCYHWSDYHYSDMYNVFVREWIYNPSLAICFILIPLVAFSIAFLVGFFLELFRID